jgi:hypothetical protein
LKSLKIEICKSIILLVVLYAFDTWSFVLRAEYRLRVYEDGVMRIFGPKREEVAGGCRRLHDEEFYNLYVKDDWMVMACSTHRRDESCIVIRSENLKGRD